MHTKHARLIGGALALGQILLSSSPAMAQNINNVSPQLIPSPIYPGLSCTVSVGKPHYSTYFSQKNQDYIDTHTYVSCNENAHMIQPVAYLYVQGLFGSNTYWSQMPAGGGTFYNVASAKSYQSKSACTYGQYWYYAATGLAYINGGPAQNASNSYSNVYVPCFSNLA